MSERRAAGLIDYALLVALAGMWGSSFLLIKLALPEISPEGITAGRVAIAAVVLFGAALAARSSFRFSPKQWGLIALAGLLGNALPYGLIAWGEQEVPSGVASILMAPMPLATLVIVHFASRDEPLTGRKLLGVAVGIAGVGVLVGMSAFEQVGKDVIYQLAILGAALCYALNAVVTKFLTELPARSTFAAVMGCGFLWVLPLAIPAGDLSSGPSISAISYVVVLGLVQTALAALVMLALVRRQGAGFFSQINFLVPVVGAILGALVLHEPIGWRAWIALSLTLIGVAISRGGSLTGVEHISKRPS